MGDQDLGRAVGRLEQQLETNEKDIGAATSRLDRNEERIGHLERSVVPLRRDLGSLNIEARAHGEKLLDHGNRLTALEAPIEQAKKDRASRRKRMRTGIKQVGAILLGAFGLVEWVAKPIIGLIAENWWRGTPPH